MKRNIELIEDWHLCSKLRMHKILRCKSSIGFKKELLLLFSYSAAIFTSLIAAQIKTTLVQKKIGQSRCHITMLRVIYCSKYT